MCGRFLLRCPPENWPANLLEDGVDLQQLSLFRDGFVPRSNVSPTQNVAAILKEVSDRPRELRSLRWGLIPSWANDKKIGASMINARAETVDQKPSFRSAFRRRRCLIVTDGYYEWPVIDGRKRPVLFERPDGTPFCFAGVWERNTKLPASKDGDVDPANPLLTCTIITTGANASLCKYHDRMPVVIAPNRYATWLQPSALDEAQREELLQPAYDDFFTVTPVEKVAGV
jgi:putative SOS response-associated peptidase YedK